MENFTVVDFVLDKDGDGHVIENTYRKIKTIIIVVWMVLPCFGIITNIFNIKTFLAIGIEDGVSVSLLSLSISDLCYTASSFMFGCAMFFLTMEAVFDVILPVSPLAFTIFFFDISMCMYSITGMTTTFLAVARCMCVAKPLHFKHVFTRSRSIAIHTFFAVSALTCYSSILAQMGTKTAFDRSVNVTRPMLWFSDIREAVKHAVFFVFDTILTFATQIIIIVCVMIMAASLRKSLKFRHENKAETDENKDSKDSKYKLSGKELQVLKQVTLISAVFILCSLPKMFNSVYGLLEPEFAIGKKLIKFYHTMQYIRNAFEIVNSASTVFIYYNYNSRFRAKFFKGFRTQANEK